MIKLIGSAKPHLLVTGMAVTAQSAGPSGTPYCVQTPTSTASPGNYIKSASQLLISGSWTLEFWFKMPNNAGAVGADAFLGVPGSYETGIWIGANSNRWYPRIGDGVGNEASNDANYFSPSLNVPHHFAMVSNGANATAYCYLDGTSVWSVAIGNWTPVLINSASPLGLPILSSYNSGITFSFQEVRVWAAALNAATINAWNSQFITAEHPNFSSLKIYWKFFEGTGSNLADSSGNGYNGTLIGNCAWASAIVTLSGGQPTVKISDTFGNSIYIPANGIQSRFFDGAIANEVVGS